MNDIRELLGREIKIDDKEGEIVDILGTQYVKIDFFNINDGSTSLHINDVMKFLR